RRLGDLPERVVPLAGNTPILLDDAASVWVVLAGHVDVFTVRLAGGRTVGARRHVFRVDVGEALFGMGLRHHAVGLLATRGRGTRLLHWDRAKLAELAGTPAAPRAAALVEDWLTALSPCLAPNRPAGTTDDAPAPARASGAPAPGRFEEMTAD